MWGRHPTIETNEFSQNDKNFGEDMTRRPHSTKLTSKGHWPGAAAQGVEPLGLRFEPRSGMISLCYKLLVLLQFRFGTKYL
jgi:hypothetical protein